MVKWLSIVTAGCNLCRVVCVVEWVTHCEVVHLIATLLTQVRLVEEHILVALVKEALVFTWAHVRHMVACLEGPEVEAQKGD